MNGGAEINKDDLLDTLERMTTPQFAKLFFKLDVPKGLMPGEDKEPTIRAIALIDWAKAPGGCGLEKIKQTLQEMDIHLDQLNCTSKDPNQIHTKAEAQLFNFDHKTTLTTFTTVVEQLEEREGAGIFILQECYSQGGKYCSKRLINYLKNNTAEGNFHPAFNINYLGGEISLKGLLYRLASQLKNNREEEKIENLTEKDLREIIIKKIDDLVPEKESGRTYLFHIKNYDSLLMEQSFWECFVKDFWSYFVQKLPGLTEKHPFLKLIFLFESNLSIEVSPNYIYTFPEAFTRTKIVKLPLEPCDIGEIKTWLQKFSGLPKSIRDQILFIVDKLGDRKPSIVYDIFLERLEEYLQNV